MRAKIKTFLEIVIILSLLLALIGLYNCQKDQEMDEYAEEHNCTWVVQGAHDICK